MTLSQKGILRAKGPFKIEIPAGSNGYAYVKDGEGKELLTMYGDVTVAELAAVTAALNEAAK